MFLRFCWINLSALQLQSQLPKCAELLTMKTRTLQIWSLTFTLPNLVVWVLGHHLFCSFCSGSLSLGGGGVKYPPPTLPGSSATLGIMLEPVLQGMTLSVVLDPPHTGGDAAAGSGKVALDRQATSWPTCHGPGPPLPSDTDSCRPSAKRSFRNLRP